MRILVVDDEPAFRENLVDLLKKDSIEIDAVSNGLEAYTLLKKGRYDLLITDYIMPKMTGLDLIRVCKEEGNRIPTVFLTGRDHAELRRHAWEYGLFDYVEKSTNSGEIVETVESFITMKPELKKEMLEQFHVDAFKIPFPVIATRIHKTTFCGLVDYARASDLELNALVKLILSET